MKRKASTLPAMAWRWPALGVLAVASLLAGCAPEPSARPERAPVRVLYIEETTFASHGRESLESLRRHTLRLLPATPLEWAFVTADPADGDQIQAAIAAQRPAVVVFANDAFLEGLAGRSIPVPMIASSSREPAALERLAAALRRDNELALVSWQATDEARSLEALERMRGAPVRTMTAFADRDRIDAGVLRGIEALARSRGVELDVVEYTDFRDFEAAFAARMAVARPDAVYLPISHELLVHVDEVPGVVERHGVPALYTRGDQVLAGGLLSRDAPDGEVYRQLARYLVLVLYGARPSTLPIAVPSRTQLALNLKAAATLGYTVPYELLVEAGEIHR